MINVLPFFPTLLAASTPGAGDSVIDLTPSGAFGNLGKITIPLLVSGLINVVLIVAVLVFFFMLVLGGIRWMVSGGDKAGTQDARNQVTAALIGLAIVFSTWAILVLIKTLFGVNILGGFDIPTLFPAKSGTTGISVPVPACLDQGPC